MSEARRTAYIQTQLNGHAVFITQENLLFPVGRLVHASLHQYVPPARMGVQTHGVWLANAHTNARFGNTLMMSVSYADRAKRRIDAGSARVRNAVAQPGGRTRYDVSLSSTHDIGTAESPAGVGGAARRTVWVRHARIVLGPPITIYEVPLGYVSVAPAVAPGAPAPATRVVRELITIFPIVYP